MRTKTKNRITDNRPKTIAVLSSCMDDWGGCEELWARAIPLLQERGVRVVVFKERINKQHPEFVALSQKGIELTELEIRYSRRKRMAVRLGKMIRRAGAKMMLSVPGKPEESFTKQLKAYRPDLVVISQAINFDALPYAYQCLSLQIPYVIVSQKAVDFYWPNPEDRSYMTECFQQAKKCFFVSQHNRRMTEEQFGTRFLNSHIIYNPVKIAAKALPFPCTNGGYKLACVGRLFLLDKGQDILLRVLSDEKWRSRPVTVSFIGTGPDKDALEAMAALLHVTNIEFKGQVRDIENLWLEYHALVLPSRSEGLPLVILEAMAAGRPVIISNAGGNAEFVEEDVTGFIGYANEESFGDAMERAWQRRANWETMGKKASSHIAQKLPHAPEKDFAKYINALINE